MMKAGKNGEDVLLMQPGLENSKDSKSKVRLLVWSHECVPYMRTDCGDRLRGVWYQ